MANTTVGNHVQVAQAGASDALWEGYQEAANTHDDRTPPANGRINNGKLTASISSHPTGPMKGTQGPYENRRN